MSEASFILDEIQLLKDRVRQLELLLKPSSTSEEGARHANNESSNRADALATVALPPMQHAQQLAQVHHQQPLPIPVDVPMAATRVVMHQIVLPSEVDTFGICFGGQVLSWIDVCAGMSAKTLARCPCVTASVDSVHFLRPCRLGTVVIIAAMVNRTFSSSMEVGVRVETEDMRTGIRYHSCSAYLTFVAVGNTHNGGRRPQLPRVTASSEEHERIFADAELRREARLRERARLREDPVLASAMAMCRLRPITHRDACPTLPRSIEAEGLSFATGAARIPVTPDLTTAHMTQMIMPQHANTLNITFGGQVMAWMEQCAYISASRMRGPHTLTASMDSVTFAKSTRVGDILYVTSQVTAIFGSSMEVMVSVHGESPMVGELFHCADAYVTVVTVSERSTPDDMQRIAGDGDDGRRDVPQRSGSSGLRGVERRKSIVMPVQLPFELVPQTSTEILRYQGALKRREERLGARSSLAVASQVRRSLDGQMPAESGASIGTVPLDAV